MGWSQVNRVRVEVEPTNAADQHGAGPTMAKLWTCTEPDLQRWIGPEQTDLESKMLNINPYPLQRNGVAIPEGTTGPQTLCGV